MAFRNVILIINLSQNNFIGMQPLFSTSNWHLENLKDKHQDIIDLYVDEGDSFSHYSASLITNWRFECVYVKIAHKRKSKIAMVRFQKFIDIFMVDSNGNLLKYFSNPSTNWQYKENEGCSIKDINPSVNPIAFRFPDQYHIICVELNGDLILVQSGRHTAWANQVQSIRKGKNISGLSGIGYRHSKSDIQIGYQHSQSDIFFIEDGSVVHGKALKDGDNWKYVFNTISNGPFQNITACTRCDKSINLY